jgi:diguanylate cyclase (GGDEF)-like protein/PAS domain S-box-containing protein
MKPRPPAPGGRHRRPDRRDSDLADERRGFRRALLRVETARELAEAIFQAVREPLLILDSRQRVLAANRAFYETFHVTHRATMGRSLYDLGIGQWNVARLRLLLEKILPDNSSFDGFDIDSELPRLGRRIMSLNARRIRGRAGSPSRILLAFEDVTGRRRAEDDLRTVSVTDPLTNLRNRRGLLAVAAELARQYRGTRTGLLAIFVDVDNLKVLNDRHGHREGDRLLGDVARLLRATFPEARALARIGGDEFVVLFEDDGSLLPETLLTRLRRIVALDNRQSARTYRLSLSAGAARGDARELEDILARADAAMYEEKIRRRKRRR